MPNYMNLMGEHYPEIECYCDGDPTVYGNITFVGSPTISQGTLDALTESPRLYQIEAPLGSPLPADDTLLQYEETDNTWHYKTAADASVSVIGHPHTESDITDLQPSKVIQHMDGAISKTSGTIEIAGGDVTPPITEGVELWSQAITPTDAANTVEITTNMILSAYANAGHGYGALDVAVTFYRDSTCILVLPHSLQSAEAHHCGSTFIDTPATTSSVTYSCRVGRTSGEGAWYVNGLYLKEFQGLIANQGYTVKEIRNA